ncbi:hypothetical protein ACIRXL_12410 (plasmid) [Avibacterium paragallinarum]
MAGQQKIFSKTSRTPWGTTSKQNFILYLLALSRGHTSKINFLHIKSPLGGARSRALPCNKKITNQN